MDVFAPPYAPPVTGKAAVFGKRSRAAWWDGISWTRRLAPGLAVLTYLTALTAAGHVRVDHFLLGAALALLYYTGPPCRSLFQFLLPFFLMFALYDGQTVYAPHLRLAVHVREPFLFDLAFFGIAVQGGILTPAGWWQGHTHPLPDAVTGLGYLLYYPVFLGMAAWFRFRRSPGLPPAKAVRLSSAMMWGMLFLMVATIITFLLYPAAPPWYVERHGLGPAMAGAAPSAAGAVRAEALFGLNIFSAYWSRTPNVFGAIPSYHVALTLFTVYFAFRFRALRTAAIAFHILTCFSAVYLNHHWVLDLIVGSAYGLAAAVAADYLYARRAADQPALKETANPALKRIRR